MKRREKQREKKIFNFDARFEKCSLSLSLKTQPNCVCVCGIESNKQIISSAILAVVTMGFSNMINMKHDTFSMMRINISL